MRFIRLYAATIMPLLLLFSQANAQTEIAVPEGESRFTLLFDHGWRFYKGGAQGAQEPEFDDSGWRQLDLPHDWSIEDDTLTGTPFDKNAIGQVSTGFTKGGTAWYRKSFLVGEGTKGRRVHLQFDGIYMNAELWLNGKKLGEHPYGYTSFWYDITEQLQYGKQNVLAVKVRNEGENSRWYSGSGIYRHVWLNVMEPVHVAHWGTAVTTPEVNKNTAKVHLAYEVQNENKASSQIRVQTTILDAAGKEVGKAESSNSVEGTGKKVFEQDIIIKSPLLWSVNQPNLYTARTVVFQGNSATDQFSTTFGIRTISFDAKTGFQLNGQAMELKGGCIHHDNGPLGAKAYDRAEERKVELLKASGYNAIRSSHNPPSPALLEACDRLGMMVIDEAFDAWIWGKNPFDYSLYFDEWWQKDVESMVYRDRNHPSIIMWSIGNEIPGMDDPKIVEASQMQASYIHKIDPSRPVSAGVNNLGPQKDPFFATLDVAGYNYAVAGDHGKEDIYLEDHQRVPNRVMYGSESYPLEAFDSWMAAKDKPWVIGDFVWTAFDYIGEASIGWLGFWQTQNFYPWTLAYCGDIDICGWKRPQSYYRDAFWGEKPMVHVVVKSPVPSFEENPERVSWSKWHFDDVRESWNWAGFENQDQEVEVYTSCDQVELLLNDKSLGRKPTNRSTKNKASWKVPYKAGTLKAVGYVKGKKVATSQLTTADKATQLKLTPDRSSIKADGQDLVYITVEVLDAKGNLNPDADPLINFELEGPGVIVAVGNANPMSIESYTQPQRKAWRGKCLVIVKSGEEAGKISLKATAENLKSEPVSIILGE